MKKNYINPTITIVDLNIEALMVCTSCNVKTLDDNTGAYVLGSDIKGSATSGEEMDANGYRNNLWGD